MPALDFLDTNILVYAYDPSDPQKQNISKAMVRRAVAGEFVISTQVLAEFAVTLLHKMSPAALPRDVATVLDALGPIHVIAPDADMVGRAVAVRAEYGIHFYDGMIVAAAERASCPQLWSEDLNAGQCYFGVTARNPFR
jgi:predicted nucleic acid-binding protein